MVKELFTKTAQGYTIVSIIRELKERGFRMKSGKYLDKSKAYKIITNSKYIGKVTHYGVVYDNIFPRIIDDETWGKVQEIHKQNMHAPATKKNVYEFLLTGNVICANGQEKLKCRIKPSNQCKIILAKKEVATGVTSRST